MNVYISWTCWTNSPHSNLVVASDVSSRHLLRPKPQAGSSTGSQSQFTIAILDTRSNTPSASHPIPRSHVTMLQTLHLQ